MTPVRMQKSPRESGHALVLNSRSGHVHHFYTARVMIKKARTFRVVLYLKIYTSIAYVRNIIF